MPPRTSRRRFGNAGDTFRTRGDSFVLRGPPHDEFVAKIGMSSVTGSFRGSDHDVRVRHFAGDSLVPAFSKRSGTRVALDSAMQRTRPVVALLESRMSRELARLVTKHGGDPLCVPTVRECPELDLESVARLTRMLDAGGYDVVVFPTGVSVSLLMETADRAGLRADLVTALRRVTTVCRGPKPTAALRGFGVPPTLTARESFTSAEVIDALSTVELSGRPVLLFCAGERSETLAETLIARGAKLDELWLYRWQLPEDTTAMERLVHDVLAGGIDALAVTCQIQFRHLLRVAERMGRSQELTEALDGHVVVGAVGPSCRAILESYGVRARVVPDHPKMGPLVAALMHHFEKEQSRPLAEKPLLASGS